MQILEENATGKVVLKIISLCFKFWNFKKKLKFLAALLQHLTKEHSFLESHISITLLFKGSLSLLLSSYTHFYHLILSSAPHQPLWSLKPIKIYEIVKGCLEKYQLEILLCLFLLYNKFANGALGQKAIPRSSTRSRSNQSS